MVLINKMEIAAEVGLPLLFYTGYQAEILEESFDKHSLFLSSNLRHYIALSIGMRIPRLVSPALEKWGKVEVDALVPRHRISLQIT